MAHVNADRFKKLADAVASDFVAQNIPLNTSVQKLAQSMDMSHEQIRRLCEATNNATFNQVFNSKDKTASDRIVEFDVADPDKIIGSLIRDAVPVSEKTAAFYEYRTLELAGDTVKVADYADDEPAPKAFTDADKRTVRKVMRNLSMEKMAWELEYVDGLNDLSDSFKRIYDTPPFESFQKEACQLYGNDVLPELNVLRERRGLDPIESVSFNKTAGFIDDSGFPFKATAKLIALRQKIARATVATRKLENLL